MTLDEFVKSGMDKLMVDAAKLAVELAETPEQAASIPMAFFIIEQRLHSCWDAAMKEMAAREANRQRG